MGLCLRMLFQTMGQGALGEASAGCVMGRTCIGTLCCRPQIQTRIANEKYLRAHKEVELLLSGFFREMFLKRPDSVLEFAAAAITWNSRKGNKTAFKGQLNLCRISCGRRTQGVILSAFRITLRQGWHRRPGGLVEQIQTKPSAETQPARPSGVKRRLLRLLSGEERDRRAPWLQGAEWVVQLSGGGELHPGGSWWNAPESPAGLQAGRSTEHGEDQDRPKVLSSAGNLTVLSTDPLLHQDPVQVDFHFRLTPHGSAHWHGLFCDHRLFLDIPNRALDRGNRESLTATLEYVEEKTNVDSVFVNFQNDRKDKGDLLRAFSYMGFDVVRPDHPALPPWDNVIFMVYPLERDQGHLSSEPP
ncbi:Ornithine decarboxylase antizyme 3 [Fukomys damarensis]|uniref:Ornithine decarboxylase antizyme 3 n=1 Tax=Fukomys damarensis TaxID=885580 RepID=A0A091CIJ4_FUKDA|nr:Ornithine decarboxylase antizyme 3 [Fukomys damarensis]